tara:strand:+ start:49 stop:171 length:123 start_codon:yes stop_codon:yes gene_type:complete
MYLNKNKLKDIPLSVLKGELESCLELAQDLLKEINKRENK